MRRDWQRLWIIPTLALSGCVMVPAQPAGNDDAGAGEAQVKALKELPLPPRPPPVPPAQSVRLDPALRERARTEIIAASRAPDAVLRANAMEAAQNGLGGAEGAPIVLTGLKDDRPIVRYAAAMAAGSLRLESARPLLLGLADESDDMVRIGARFALHKLGDYRRSHDLEQTATSPNPRTRAVTAQALGLLGEPSAIKLLRPMLRDPDANVRIQVSEALWRLGDEEGLESLVATLVGQYPDDQMVAILALAAPRNAVAARPYLRGRLTTQYPAVNLVAARAMGMIGLDDGYTLAIQGAESKEPLERHLAALALGAIGRADAQPALAKLLSDPEASVRLAAAVAVLQLKGL
mgnify:CR=1 FL=1